MASLSAFELPRLPDSPAAAIIGALVALAGVAVIMGASNLIGIGAFVAEVLTGSLAVAPPDAATIFSVAAGVGGALGNMAAGSNMSSFGGEDLPAGWVYPAVLCSGVISAIAGYALVPDGPDHPVAQFADRIPHFAEI